MVYITIANKQRGCGSISLSNSLFEREQEDMATAGQVRKSIQRFHDYAEDLILSDMNTFEDTLNLFIDFCETDSVFSGIHAQLQSIPHADFDQWYASQSFALTFPTDLEVRMSLMYELLRRIRDGRLPFQTFAISFFHLGTNSITPYVQALNDAITRPLVRELSYRLEELIDQLPDDRAAPVPQASIQIIHQATNVIQQSARGANITQTATQNLAPELDHLFRELELEVRNLRDHAEKQHEYLELIESARELAASDKAKPNAIKALLSVLPPVDSLVSITASILRMLGG
jgi:hypothetical protein